MYFDALPATRLLCRSLLSSSSLANALSPSRPLAARGFLLLYVTRIGLASQPETHPPRFNVGQALLSLLKGSKPGLAVGGAGSETTEHATGILFSRLVRAHCRRQDVTSALAEVAEMEAAGGEPSPEMFSYLLDACAIARPPLLREMEAVWARVEVSAGPCMHW